MSAPSERTTTMNSAVAYSENSARSERKRRSRAVSSWRLHLLRVPAAGIANEAGEKTWFMLCPEDLHGVRQDCGAPNHRTYESLLAPDAAARTSVEARLDRAPPTVSYLLARLASHVVSPAANASAQRVEPPEARSPAALTEHPLLLFDCSEGAGFASQVAEKPCLGVASHSLAGVTPFGPTLAPTLRFVALG